MENGANNVGTIQYSVDENGVIQSNKKFMEIEAMTCCG